MKNWLSKIIHWIEHSETRQLESYLAQSASAADLERRMRDWESKHRGFDQLPLMRVKPSALGFDDERKAKPAFRFFFWDRRYVAEPTGARARSDSMPAVSTNETILSTP